MTATSIMFHLDSQERTPSVELSEIENSFSGGTIKRLKVFLNDNMGSDITLFLNEKQYEELKGVVLNG